MYYTLNGIAQRLGISRQLVWHHEDKLRIAEDLFTGGKYMPIYSEAEAKRFAKALGKVWKENT